MALLRFPFLGKDKEEHPKQRKGWEHGGRWLRVNSGNGEEPGVGEGHRGQKQTRKGLEHQAEGTGSEVRKCLLAMQEGWSGGEAVLRWAVV